MLSTTVKNIQDIMRKDPGVDGDAQRISQLSWMIFLKILDEQEQEYEQLDNSYQSPIPDKLRWHNWACTLGLTGDELLNFINNDLFKSLRELSINFPNYPLNKVVSSVFEDSYNYMRSGYLIRQVVDKINDSIHFKNAIDRHLFGDIYEKILRDLQNAGNAGEFYTPRALTEFVVDMVDPRLGEKVLDPACGTGGFLTCCINHIRNRYVYNTDDEFTLQQSILGIEKKPLPHLLCITNMLLHNIKVPSGIQHSNSLAKPLSAYTLEDHVQVVVTNPPFGGQEEDGIDANFPEKLRNKETSDLFFLLIMRLLEDGGRAAVVLPDGFLFGEGVKIRIKEKLLKECNLHTIIRLPKGVFAPYTNIATNILFFTKGTSTKEVWYYEHPYPSNYKSYSKTKPITVKEFEQEKQWWNKREENAFAWKVPVEEIKNNRYNLDIKNPYYTATHKIDFDASLLTYVDIQGEINKTRKELKQQIMDSLGDEKSIKQHKFFANFDFLTENLNGIQKLREVVLGFAMRGELVQRTSSKETALDLYEGISNVREGLVKDGILRQSLPLPLIKPDKIPYQIPDTWQWVRLGNVAQVVGGGTPDTNNPEYFSDSGIPWLTPADLYRLQGKFIGRGKRDLSKLGLQKSSARILPKGSVLFSSRAPIGHVAIAANDLATNQGFKSCIPYVMEMNEFIYYFLLSAGKEIERNASGTTFKEVSGKIVQQVLLPLPSLFEQHFIVAKIDELMVLLDELATKLELLQNTQEVLIDNIANLISEKKDSTGATKQNTSLAVVVG